jgi:hypothetical protein
VFLLWLVTGKLSHNDGIVRLIPAIRKKPQKLSRGLEAKVGLVFGLPQTLHVGSETIFILKFQLPVLSYSSSSSLRKAALG